MSEGRDSFCKGEEGVTREVRIERRGREEDLGGGVSDVEESQLGLVGISIVSTRSRDAGQRKREGGRKDLKSP
jgi:hypothetical protein